MPASTRCSIIWSAKADCCHGAGRRSRLGPLLGSIEQDSFEGGVEIPTHLRHALIAILAKEGRRLVVFKNALALFVLKQNYPKRRIESSAELIVIFEAVRGLPISYWSALCLLPTICNKAP